MEELSVSGGDVCCGQGDSLRSADSGCGFGDSTHDDGPWRDRLLRAVEDMVNVANGLAWIPLDVDVAQRRVLLITRDIIAQRPYNQKREPIAWEKCSLRQWLNTTFFEALPGQIKSRAVEVVNQNPDNTQYSTSGGNPTSDTVFLLSIDEAVTYLKDNANRFATFDGSAGWWWLRSSGRRQYLAANVDYGGGLDGFGVPVSSDDGGVRPALFLNLDG